MSAPVVLDHGQLLALMAAAVGAGVPRSNTWARDSVRDARALLAELDRAGKPSVPAPAHPGGPGCQDPMVPAGLLGAALEAGYGTANAPLVPWLSAALGELQELRRSCGWMRPALARIREAAVEAGMHPDFDVAEWVTARLGSEKTGG